MSDFAQKFGTVNRITPCFRIVKRRGFVATAARLGILHGVFEGRDGYAHALRLVFVAAVEIERAQLGQARDCVLVTFRLRRGRGIASGGRETFAFMRVLQFAIVATVSLGECNALHIRIKGAGLNTASEKIGRYTIRIIFHLRKSPFLF
ncbi:hypothetical protein [Paraburkholderia rhynchosiae]|uniref:hypothetical protein n=1 Tax=Paraburkholderia rhynchosiae TaxID=487049 RepID=UPI001FC9E9B7|nr:hypothetical protein [Paraburkholderia rhynchosiae]